MEPNQYLITGGAGFIGSHLVERLVGEKKKVRVLDNLGSGKMRNIEKWIDQIEFVKGDIRDQEVVKTAVRGVDYILHQAALRSVPRSMTRPQEYHDVNVTGTLNLLLAAKEAKVKKFVLASSSSVYGEIQAFPQKEGHEGETISPYAFTKKLGEQYLRLFSRVYGLPTVSLRYFNVFGPRQGLDDDYAVVIPKFITNSLKGEDLPIYGDGSQSRDFTFIANVVDANLAACRADVGSGDAVNVACGETHSVLSLAQKIGQILEVQSRPRFLPRRDGDLPKSHADVTRLKTLLGIQSQVSFMEGLHMTVDWFKKNAALYGLVSK